MGEPRIVFVSREVYPFGSAGLGNYVTFTAAALARHAEVTVLTRAEHERSHRELVSAGDTRIPDGVRFEFIPEPTGEDAADWYGVLHLWSARACEAVARLYPDGGPDLVEFPDYFGEACVTAQAVQTLDRRFRHTTLCVRAYTTAEICAVLDGFVARDRHTRLIADLERYALRHADHFLWPGGDVLETYRRFYGERGVADPVPVPHTVVPQGEPCDAREDGGATRFLYVGRLERRKGVQNLIRAATALARDEWELTLIGGDTPTAPLGTSMREQLEMMSADDKRIRLLGRVPRDQLRHHYERADVCVSPSLWECWPNTVLEAYEHDRPVLASPVGGHLGMVEPGRTGWLLPDTGADALAEELERLVDLRAGRGAGHLVPAGAPRARFRELTDPEPVRERYLELAQRTRPRVAAGSTRAAAPLVSVVVPYFEMHDFVEETLASIRAQTYRGIEIVLVNDGSMRKVDAILEPLAERYRCRLATQVNSGLGQARNLGVDLAGGRYVLPLDSDDVLLPGFVERTVEVLESRPDLAYVTSWSEFINEDGSPHEGGYRPLGNTAAYIESENVAGAATSLMRRRLFERGVRYSPDLTSYEDWFLFLVMRDSGAYGHVIPEALFRYRVRGRSMLRGVSGERRQRLRGELDAHIREAEIAWTSSSA